LIKPKTSGREHNVSQEQNPDLPYVANAAMPIIVLITTTRKQKKGGDKSLDKFKNIDSMYKTADFKPVKGIITVGSPFAALLLSNPTHQQCFLPHREPTRS